MFQQRKKQRIIQKPIQIDVTPKPTGKQAENTIQQPIQIQSTPTSTENQIEHTNKVKPQISQQLQQTNHAETSHT